MMGVGVFCLISVFSVLSSAELQRIMLPPLDPFFAAALFAEVLFAAVFLPLLFDRFAFVAMISPPSRHRINMLRLALVPRPRGLLLFFASSPNVNATASVPSAVAESSPFRNHLENIRVVASLAVEDHHEIVEVCEHLGPVETFNLIGGSAACSCPSEPDRVVKAAN
jgi:hypothetical protein